MLPAMTEDEFEELLVTGNLIRKEVSVNLVPLLDNVVIKRETADEKSRGGIILPDSAKESRRRRRPDRPLHQVVRE